MTKHIHSFERPTDDTPQKKKQDQVNEQVNKMYIKVAKLATYYRVTP